MSSQTYCKHCGEQIRYVKNLGYWIHNTGYLLCAVVAGRAEPKEETK